jgi:hypothetical protein
MSRLQRLTVAAKFTAAAPAYVRLLGERLEEAEKVVRTS